MSGTDTERLIQRTRTFRAATILAIALNAAAFAASIAVGTPLVIAPPLMLVILLVLVLMQTRAITTLKWARDLRREYEPSRLPVQAATPAADLGPCAHASAEPVDLFNPTTGEYDGERVAWVCPDCNEELPAGWSPEKKVLRGEAAQAAASPRRLTATASELAAPAPGGTGRLRAAPGAPRRLTATASELAVPGAARAYVPETAAPVASYALARTDGEITAARAAAHFEALAKVGLEHCLSYCPLCLYRLFGPLPPGVKPDKSMWRWTEENWGWKQ